MSQNEGLSFIRATVWDCMQNQIQLTPTEKRKDLTALYLEVVYRFKPYLLSDPLLAKRVWSEIRADRDLTDFVMEATSRFRYSVECSDYDWDKVVESIVVSISTIDARNKTDKNYSIVDDDMMDALAIATDELVCLFKHNPWLVMIVITNLVGFGPFGEEG